MYSFTDHADLILELQDIKISPRWEGEFKYWDESLKKAYQDLLSEKVDLVFTVQVSTSALSNCSPVLQRMLGDDALSKPLGTRDVGGQSFKVLSLEKLDLGSMIVLLQIMHHKTIQIPPVLSLAKLIVLTFQAEQLGCSDLLVSWMSLWMMAIKNVEFQNIGFWLRLATKYDSIEAVKNIVDVLTKVSIQHATDVDVETGVVHLKHPYTGFTINMLTEGAEIKPWQEYYGQISLVPSSSSFDGEGKHPRGTKVVAMKFEGVPKPILEHIKEQRDQAIASVIQSIAKFIEDVKKCNRLQEQLKLPQEGKYIKRTTYRIKPNQLDPNDCFNPFCAYLACKSIMNSLQSEHFLFLKEEYPKDLSLYDIVVSVTDELQMKTLRFGTHLRESHWYLICEGISLADIDNILRTGAEDKRVLGSFKEVLNPRNVRDISGKSFDNGPYCPFASRLCDILAGIKYCFASVPGYNSGAEPNLHQEDVTKTVEGTFNVTKRIRENDGDAAALRCIAANLANQASNASAGALGAAFPGGAYKPDTPPTSGPGADGRRRR